MNRITQQELRDVCGDRAMRDFAPLGVKDADQNRERRHALMSSLPGRVVVPVEENLGRVTLTDAEREEDVEEWEAGFRFAKVIGCCLIVLGALVVYAVLR